MHEHFSNIGERAPGLPSKSTLMHPGLDIRTYTLQFIEKDDHAK